MRPTFDTVYDRFIATMTKRFSKSNSYGFSINDKFFLKRLYFYNIYAKRSMKLNELYEDKNLSQGTEQKT